MNNDNAAFSSTWEIDQLVTNEVAVVTTGINAVYTFTGSDIPIIDCQFRRTTGDAFYSPGTSSSGNTLATLITFYTYIQNNTLYAYVSQDGFVHYMVMEDKINY